MCAFAGSNRHPMRPRQPAASRPGTSRTLQSPIGHRRFDPTCSRQVVRVSGWMLVPVRVGECLSEYECGLSSGMPFEDSLDLVPRKALVAAHVRELMKQKQHPARQPSAAHTGCSIQEERGASDGRGKTRARARATKSEKERRLQESGICCMYTDLG